MSSEALVFIGILVAVLVIRFVARTVVNKGGDAIDNAIANAINKKKGHTEENLSETYAKEENDQ